MISVVMPTYNRSAVIQNAIRSIIDQTYKDWELIIIDDGSDDSTERIVKSFANPAIKYFKYEHTGNISKLRNLGVQKAKGELIVVQDSDDMSFPNRLEEIWKQYQKTEADIFYHSMYLRFYDPYTGSITRDIRPAQPFNKEYLLKEQYIPGQIAYKREVALKTPYDENVPTCDDYMFLLDLALNNYAFSKIDLYLYDYMNSSDSINVMGETDGRRDKDVAYILNKLKTVYNI